jgi:hypothetical protein
MPPWGGFGANTAIQDAHNLAWKLAAVLNGRAGPALLDTYEAERRPIALTVSALAGSLNDERGLMATRGGLSIFWRMRKVFPYLLVGYGYTSAAIVREPGQPAPGPGTTELRGRPGTRAPHVWLSRGGSRISTLDLFGRGFVLIAGHEGTAWIDAPTASPRHSASRSKPYASARISTTSTVDGTTPAASRQQAPSSSAPTASSPGDPRPPTRPRMTRSIAR